MTATRIWSVGHSTLSYEEFLQRLRAVGITAIADVRSAPYSRTFPHFNREPLKAALSKDAIAYVFLGKELGGRPASDDFFTDGVADYEKMARDPAFAKGLTRLCAGATKFNIAMMCSERNPLDCHRCLLVSRALVDAEAQVFHVLSAERIVSHEWIENELLAMADKSHADMFAPRIELLNDAYRARSRKVAYAKNRAPNLLKK
ncbi:DUF488 domain-containing protein [Sphingomonas sp. H160509]|uniref:DUF488 domain-containing protein n=1 Tax=Sphingomonas sp. H160509 TaxID=2955313 RepID=UPI002097802E|nr:DUF488 domain-containing protein [Sphingomonas sp. H160509]MDD1449782.1 DUF488 domain-containing protein [Sphingomonas sp. H160509]